MEDAPVTVRGRCGEGETESSVPGLQVVEMCIRDRLDPARDGLAVNTPAFRTVKAE